MNLNMPYFRLQMFSNFLFQIIGWFHLRNVVLNIVNLNSVYPYGGQPQPGPVIESSPFQKNTSIRKSFSKERPTKQGVDCD